MSGWTYKGEVVNDISSDYLGFVYRLTEIETGKKYIGYKRAWVLKKGRQTSKQSNWKSYNSSGAALAGLDVNNPKKFKKEILYFGTNQTDLRTCEIYLLLFYYMNDRWEELYNENINIRLRIRKDKRFNEGVLDEYLRVFDE